MSISNTDRDRLLKDAEMIANKAIRDDREQVLKDAEMVAMNAISANFKGVFKRINDDQHYVLEELSGIKGEMSQINASVSTISATTSDFPATKERVTKLEISIAEMPQKVSDQISKCRHQRELKERWNVRTILTIIAVVISLGSAAVAIKGCSVPDVERAESADNLPTKD